MAEYTNQALEIEEQIERLEKNGLIIADREQAIRILSIVSYFRLANYWRPMEVDKVKHLFKPNSTFDNALSLYYFDKELRALIFAAIQSIEIAVLRNCCAYHARIWNRRFSMIPQIPQTMQSAWIENMDFDNTKLYPLLCCVVYWLNAISS